MPPVLHRSSSSTRKTAAGRGTRPRAASVGSSSAVAIIVAGGRGVRLGGEAPKAFIDLAGKTLLRRTAEALAVCEGVSALIVVAPSGYEKAARQETAATGKLRAVVTGGVTRQDSVRAGLARTTPQDLVVLVHDAARPFVDPHVVARVLKGVSAHGAAIPVTPVVDTIKAIHGGRIGATVPRDSLGAAQTPQGFERSRLLTAYTRAARAGVVLTDEAMAMERDSLPVAAVQGSARNFKITTPDDLDRARRLLAAPADTAKGPLSGFRVGQGFDVHPLVAGRRLMLGGVRVPSEVGLDGHSDGDVLLHALCDALLGAAALGEIGSLFPSSDSLLKGAASSRFVAEVLKRLDRAHLSIVNVDATLIAERPRLSKHLQAMKKNIAVLLDVGLDRVSIKVKSTDALGAIGRGEGIAAQVLTLLAHS